MLLTIHNLPLNIRLAEVKSLIQSKCGFSEMILDNLIREESGMKVTVGLAEDEDAAILVRKINGLTVRGRQLFVEDVRKKKQSNDQPYYQTKAVAAQQQKRPEQQPYYQLEQPIDQEQQYYQPNASEQQSYYQGNASAVMDNSNMMSMFMQANNPYMSQMGMQPGYVMANVGYQNPYMAYGQQPMQLTPSGSGMYQSGPAQPEQTGFRPQNPQNRGQNDTDRDRRSRSRDRAGREETSSRQSDRGRYDREQSVHDRRRRESPPRNFGYDENYREREQSRNDDRKRERSKSPVDHNMLPRKVERAIQYRLKKQHREYCDKYDTNISYEEWRDITNAGPPQKRSRFEPIDDSLNPFAQNESETNSRRGEPYQSKQDMRSSPNPKFQPGPSSSTFQPRSSNPKFQPDFAYEQRDAQPKFQPRPQTSAYKQRQESPKFKPRSSNTEFQPRGPRFQPREERPKFQPRSGDTQFRPRGANSQYQPRGARPPFQPRGATSQFQPRGPKAKFQPGVANPKFQPQTAIPGSQPQVVKTKVITEEKITSWINSTAAAIAKEMIDKIILHIDENIFLKELKDSIRQRLIRMYAKRKPKFIGEVGRDYRAAYPKKSDRQLFVDALERATVLDSQSKEHRKQKQLAKEAESVKAGTNQEEKPEGKADARDETAVPQGIRPSVEDQTKVQQEIQPVPVAMAFRAAPSLSNQLANIYKEQANKGHKSEMKLEKQRTKLMFMNDDIVTSSLDEVMRKALEDEVNRLSAQFMQECPTGIKGFTDVLQNEVLKDFKTAIRVNVSRRLLNLGPVTMRVFCHPHATKALIEPFLKKLGVTDIKKSVKKPMFMASVKTFHQHDKLIASGPYMCEGVFITFKPLQMGGSKKKFSKQQIDRQRDHVQRFDKYNAPGNVTGHVTTDSQQILEEDLIDFDKADEENEFDETFTEDANEVLGTTEEGIDNQVPDNQNDNEVLGNQNDNEVLGNQSDNEVLGNQNDNEVDDSTNNDRNSLNDSLSETIEFTMEDQQIIEDALMGTESRIMEEKLDANGSQIDGENDSEVKIEDLNNLEQSDMPLDEGEKELMIVEKTEVDENDLEDW